MGVYFTWIDNVIHTAENETHWNTAIVYSVQSKRKQFLPTINSRLTTARRVWAGVQKLVGTGVGLQTITPYQSALCHRKELAPRTRSQTFRQSMRLWRSTGTNDPIPLPQTPSLGLPVHKQQPNISRQARVMSLILQPRYIQKCFNWIIWKSCILPCLI